MHTSSFQFHPSFHNRGGTPGANHTSTSSSRKKPVIPQVCQPPTERSSSNIIKQIVQIVIIPAALAPIHRDLLRLLLLLADGFQDALQLLLVDFLAQLAAARQHDQAVLDVLRAGSFHQPDAADAVGGGGLEDLLQDGGADFGFAFPMKASA